MATRDTSDGDRADRDRPWLLIASLLIGIFVARALLYLSVLPPLEGWDEHQHLGYVVFLAEQREIPVLGKSAIPTSLQPFYASVPHPEFGLAQAKLWGGAGYRDFWARHQPAAAAAVAADPLPTLGLYQAQHPPLAYALAVPIWRVIGTKNPLAAIYVMRGLNVLVVAAALLVFSVALREIVRDLAVRTAVLALVCVHPLYLQNVARVANDGLAVATGLAGISALFLPRPRSTTARAALAAALIAASAWSKQTGLALLPALLAGIPLVAYLRAESRRRVARATLVGAGVFLVLIAPLWVWNVQTYGSIVTTQEAVKLSEQGTTLTDVAHTGLGLPWLRLLRKLFVPGTAWVGGWSSVPENEMLHDAYGWLFAGLVVAASLGGLRYYRWQQTSAPGAQSPAGANATGGLVVSAAVVLMTAAGMVYHAVLSRALFGFAATNAWYFMTALPFFLLLLVRGATQLHRRGVLAAIGLLAILLLVIDVEGTLARLPTFYAATGNADEIWSRLSAIHPAFPQPGQRAWFIASEVILLLLLVGALAREAVRRRQKKTVPPWATTEPATTSGSRTSA